MKQNLIKYGLGLTALLLLNSPNLMAENNVSTIDTLVVYSQGVKDQYNGDAETRINHLFTTTNKIYADSGLNIELSAVRLEQLDLDDSARSSTILGEVRSNAEIQALRDTVGADEVIIYRPYANDGYCGVAYYNPGYQAYAYAHVTVDCAGYVTAHEVGHNMYLAHSAKQDPEAGHGRGHGIEDQFTTVMAYSQAYNGSKIYKFSDPDLDCNGEPCGIEEGLENEADAVKEILVRTPVIVNFREHIIIDDTNKTDDNDTDTNKPDDNNTDNGGLEAAKLAYEAQLLVVDASKATLKELRADIKTQRTAAKTTYKAKVKEAFTIYKTNKKSAYTALQVELNKLRQVYLTARTDRKAKNITRAQYKAIITQVRADRKTHKATYKAAISEKRDTLKATIKTLKEERTATITEAKEAYTSYKTDVYLVEVAKLSELKKIYDDLLNA